MNLLGLADYFETLWGEMVGEFQAPAQTGPAVNLPTQTQTLGNGKSKVGRRGYGTVAEKKQAVLDWDALDPDNRLAQVEWLEQRFGATGGVLNVSPRTFQGWRRYLKKIAPT
jgi:hypothetical protein